MKENEPDYIKSTSEGRLYIETTDFFKISKVIELVKKLKESKLCAEIDKLNENN